MQPKRRERHQEEKRRESYGRGRRGSGNYRRSSREDRWDDDDIDMTSSDPSELSFSSQEDADYRDRGFSSNSFSEEEDYQ